MEATIPSDKLGLVLRIGLFVFLAYVGLAVFYNLLRRSGPADRRSRRNVSGRRGRPTRSRCGSSNADGCPTWGSAGMTSPSRNICFGVSQRHSRRRGVHRPRSAVRAPRRVQRDPEFPASLPSFVFLTVPADFRRIRRGDAVSRLRFSDTGEGSGPFSALLPTSLLFAFAHAGNQNVSCSVSINTFGFGLVLGYAYLRSRDLWLPIAIHFGWNWALVVFGLNVSGFKMGVTGFVVRWRVSDLWSGGSYGPEASVLTCGIIVGAALGAPPGAIQPPEA